MIEQVQETAQLWRLYKRYGNGGNWDECKTPPIFTQAAAVAIAEFMVSHYNAHVGAPLMQMAVRSEGRTAYRIVG